MHLIKKYFDFLSQKQIDQFNRAEELYRYWNNKINVISRKDIENIRLHHFLHSLGIARLVFFRNGTTVLDIGTGGGFPGIPLAIVMPEANFILVDSIRKKIKVVKEIATELGLENVTAVHSRAEDLKDQYDFIVCRAVCKFPDFVKLTSGMIKTSGKNRIPNGILYLKGGDIRNETEPFRQNITVYELSAFFEEEFFKTKKLVYLPAES